MEHGEDDARTVFVRGLPFAFSDSQLEETFSEIGPVRRAFTVKDKVTGQHRGVGFVQFAVAEDAQQAISAKNGTTLEKRKINVELAKRRVSFSERKKRKGGEKIADEAQATADDPPAKKRPRPAGDAESEPEAKNKKQKQQHKEGTSAEGAGAEQKKKGPEQNAEAGKPRKGRGPSEVDAPSQKQKVARTVVIGSLTTPATADTVLTLAKKLGTVESIQRELSQADIDTHDLAKDGCKLPAAAIVFNSVRAAREAAQTFHQQRIGDTDIWARQMGGEGSKLKKWRLIVRNLPFKVTDKELKKIFAAAGFVWEVKVPRKENGQSKGFGFVGYTSKADAEKAIQTLNGTKIFKRPIAVDWTVAKSKYEIIAKKSTENEEDDKDAETASESEEEDDEQLPARAETEDAEELQEEEDDLDDALKPSDMDMMKRVLDKVVTQEVEEVKVEEKQRPEKKRPQNKNAEVDATTQVKDGCTKVDDTMERTLFVRNLPVDWEASDLRKKFSAFGRVKALRLVLHPATKKPKGTAFLEFETPEAAKLAVQAAEGADAGTSTLLIGGKHIILHFAVDKDSARSISKQKSMEEEDSDRRNLNLVTEGLIKQGTPAAQGVSDADLARRKVLQVEKATKLRSPIFHVSRTRLAFHNFPKSLTDKQLKNMFIEAVKSRATEQTPSIKQVKILKDEKEVSRGSGFVEFSEHQHALVALRVLNNNPETFTPQKRPIVEFAIENMKKLRHRESILAATKKTQFQKLAKSDNAQQDTPNGDRKSKKRKDRPEELDEKPNADEKLGKQKKRKRDNKKQSTDQVNEKQRQSKTEAQTEREQNFDRKQNAKNSSNKKKRDPEALQPKRTKVEGAANKNDKKKQKPASTEGDAGTRRGQRGKQVEDKLDKLVSEYRSKYFGGAATKSAEAAPQKALDNIKRWFD